MPDDQPKKRRGRPRKAVSQRRIKTSFEGRLKFLPGDPHVLDVQMREARNYRYLLAEQMSQIQALFAALEQESDPSAQISQEEQALQAFLWEQYRDRKHRDHILASFLAVRRRHLLERLQAAQAALELVQEFLTPDERLLHELQQALQQARDLKAANVDPDTSEEPGVNHPHIYGDVAQTKTQLAAFDAQVQQMRSAISSGIGWFESYYIYKLRLTYEARELLRQNKPIPKGMQIHERVPYGPYLKYRWREESGRRAPIYTIQMGAIPLEERGSREEEASDDEGGEDHLPWPHL